MTEPPITAGLVQDLLRDQHADLAELPLREVEGGWGNQMWRLGDELAVRVQRMDTDPAHQLKERRWLPLLAPRLPLPVAWAGCGMADGRADRSACATRSVHASDHAHVSSMDRLLGQSQGRRTAETGVLGMTHPQGRAVTR